MKFLSLLSIAFFVMKGLVFGQCNNCNTGKIKKPDYCFTHSLFENYCASFKENEKDFALSSGKKAKTIPISENNQTSYLLSLAQNKKLKLSAQDVLFIQEALDVWTIEKKKIGFSFTESGLGIKILEEGDGEIPKAGQTVKVHYTGYLEDGTKFDSSLDRNTPFSFPLAKGRVIKGWDEGVGKLKIGSKAILRIPSDLGYGSRGAGNVIPPNATLYFEITLIDVE
jgi:FKBP-type peptidyl-prolyl cis-trans isomerase